MGAVGLTVHFKGLAGLGTNPFAIDVAFLNEERWIFQLFSMSIFSSPSPKLIITHLRLAVSHGVESLRNRRRRNSVRVSQTRSQELPGDGADESLHYEEPTLGRGDRIY